MREFVTKYNGWFVYYDDMAELTWSMPQWICIKNNCMRIYPGNIDIDEVLKNLE